MKRLIIVVLIFAAPFLARAELKQTAAEKYADGNIIKILIIPGHDNDSPGAVFRDFREADMSLELAKKIKAGLSEDLNIEVTLSRDDDGYILPVQEYFVSHKKDIEDFIATHKEETLEDLMKNKITISDKVVHNNARPDVAFRLYAVNKWADESDFDFIINIHMNDDTSHWGNNVGRYGGFTIYAPDENLPNASDSRPLGEAFGEVFQKTFFKSNLPLEAEKADKFGVVPDFKLIALGANGSLFTPTILVEYSYIYEPHVAKDLFPVTSDVMANATVNAIHKFLGGTELPPNLQYEFKTVLGASTKKNNENLALQYALKELGFYPPKNFDQTDCPFTGIFGPCTQKAVKEFQRTQGLTADGIVGPKTREILNEVF